jgi:diadenylate cyclase
LISIEFHDNVNEYIETGIYLKLELIKELLINILIPNTPLYNGIIINKNEKTITNYKYFTLTKRTKIS